MYKLFHLVFHIIFIVGSIHAQTKTHILTSDTAVRIGSEILRFKGGTKIKIKDEKTVLAGVLQLDRDLKTITKLVLPIQAGRNVTFDVSGNLLSGTLRKTNRVICIKLPKPYYRCIEILGESDFSLHEDGTLQTCVLKNIDGFATAPNGNSILFNAGGKVTFRSNGILQSGYLFKDLPSIYGTFKGWCYIEFDEKGKIIKGVRDYLLPNRRHILDHIEVINGKISKAKSNYPCNCSF